MKSKYIGLLVLLVITLSSCSSNTQEVSVFVYNEEDPYVYDFAQQIIKKSDGNYTVSYSQNSQLIQNQDIVTAIENDVDVMIVNPVDRTSSYVIIEKLKQEDIPVIFFNREPLKKDLDLWDKVYYIGAPAEQPGVFQAEMIMDLFGGFSKNLNWLDENDDNVIQAVILKGEQGHQDAEARTTSVLKEFERNGFQVEVLAIKSADWSESNAQIAMQEIIDEYGTQFEVVISNNDAMAIGAIDVLRDNGYFIDDNSDGVLDSKDDSWVPVVGVDGLKQALDYIDSGYMYGTIINDTEAMVDAMIELTEALLKGLDTSDLSFDIVDEKYIWIDYKKLLSE